MSAAHTPGPWARDKYGHIVDRNGSDVHFRGVTIACAGPRVAEAETNSDLAAASPSMYALLQSAHDFIDAQSDVNRDGDGPNEAMALAASIRELLEKIDGSAS